jgi:hypothetical protein
MADWNMKKALRSVPQPYKTWIARSTLPFYFIVAVPLCAVVEGAKWCKEIAGEVVYAWREVRHW